MRVEDEYRPDDRIGRSLDFLGRSYRALDRGWEVLDKPAVDSCIYHRARPGRGQSFVSSKRLLGFPHPASCSVRTLSRVLRLLRV